MKTYLRKFALPSEEDEERWLLDDMKMRLNGVYSNYYPFRLFDRYDEAPEFDFEPITILYGGNGCGKSTILNIIASKLALDRHSRFETTDFFMDYCDLCDDYEAEIPRQSKIITSDDVFQKLNEIRAKNSLIDEERQQKWAEKLEIKSNPSLLRLSGLDDYDRWVEARKIMKQSTSQFLRERVQKNIESFSNGETRLNI